jgi:hypothetical protein
VKNAAGATHRGVFLWSPGGQIQAVALPDDPLPDGRKMVGAIDPRLNDAGLVAFLAQRSGDSGGGAYLREKGTITPVLPFGSAAPDGGKITALDFVWGVNGQNRSVLLSAEVSTHKPNNLDSLYLWSNGTLTPVAIPGQAMPGGGQLKGIYDNSGTVSFANEAGQHAFIAQLQDNSTAAYRMEADGTLSLILKSGTATDLGMITKVGLPNSSPPSVGIGLNSKGQVALPVKIGTGPATLVLLTPAAP